MPNPYRKAFYENQAEWHGYQGADDVAARHAQRCRYYEWFTRGWLPKAQDVPILDIGCGSGQFLYFLRQKGYTNAIGIDLDPVQVKIGQTLGLDCRLIDLHEFLSLHQGSIGFVAMLDIIEHLTREEAFPVLDTVVKKLDVGGRLICSVPNSESPHGFRLFDSDITHEQSFTTISLGQMLFCHGLKIKEFRDPWPAPVSTLRKVHRRVAIGSRFLESLRLRLLGLEAPTLWSPVFWAMAEKK